MNFSKDIEYPILRRPFYFLRHGETDWNVQKLCQGQKDIPLNAKGREEAYKAGELLKNISFNSICYSPLLRAKETAKILASFFPKINTLSISELKERQFGALEGKSNVQMYDFEDKELDTNEINTCNEFRIEAKDSFHYRIARGINSALSTDSPVLVVSHGRVFQALCELLDVDRVRQLANVQPIFIEPSAKGWRLSPI